MPGHLGAVAAAAHAAPLSLAGSRGVLEDPPALHVFADAQPRGFALNQLTGDRLDQPRKRAVDRVALVPVVEGDAVRRRDQLINVVRPKRAVDLIEVGSVRRPPLGRGFERATHRLSYALQLGENFGARRGRSLELSQQVGTDFSMMRVLQTETLG